jgi:parallel beta-helix repeat protein
MTVVKTHVHRLRNITMRLAQTQRLIAFIPGLLLCFGTVKLQAQTGSTSYYVSPTGSDSSPGTESLPWKTFAKAASMATAGVTVFIKQGTYSERLLPVNSGRADAPITFMSCPGDSVTITGVGLSPPTGWWAGLIWIEGLEYIKISGLRVIGSANFGIDVENSSHITLEKNYVDSTYSSGIKVYASDNIMIDANEVVRGCIGSDLEECVSVATATFLVIRNNRVHDGRSIGIDVKYGSSNAIVSKNEVYNQNGGIGIYIEAWTLHEFNIDVFENLSHDNGIGFAVTSEMGGLIEAVTVHHNVAYKNQQRGIAVVGWGGGQTHPVKNVKVYANIVWGNGFGIEIGGYAGTTLDSLRVFNNLVYRNRNAGVRVTRYDGPSGEYAMRNLSITNNTIYGNGTVGNGWDADNGGMNIFNTIPVNMLVQNNILSNNAVCTIYVSPEVLAGSLTIDYNLFDGFRNVVNEKVGTNAVYGVPLFVDSLGNDYHLQATSPCIDKGNPSQEYNDPQNPNSPGYALYPAQGTIRNDIGAYGGPYATSWDLATSVARPQTPVLNSPGDSARSVSTSPILSWNGILGAERYRVQLSTSPNFGSRLVDDSMVTDSYRYVGPLQNSTAHYWRVSATNAGGTSGFSTMRTFMTTGASDVRQPDAMIPTVYGLTQNYPNPFNPSTTIRYGLPERSLVSLAVYNTLGQLVAQLVNGEVDAGYHQATFDATSLPSGVYFCRLQAGSYTESKKLLLIR